MPNAISQQMILDVSNPRCLMEIADATSQAAELMDRLLWARLERMRGRLLAVMAKQEYGAVVRSMHWVFQSMPDSRRARVLLSPELCEYLITIARLESESQQVDRRSSSRENELSRAVVSIHELMEREGALEELTHGQTGSFLRNIRSWEIHSPAGDCVARKSEKGSWSIHSSPMVGGCVALDFESPLARHHEDSSGVMSQPSLPFTMAERLEVQRKLEQAVAAIDQAEPLYGALIRNFVRRIILRKSHDIFEEGSGRFASEHVPRHPGSIRLLNTHHPKLSVAACMESVMHEATHNLLAAWELSHGFFVPSACAYRVVSPWSGNQIPNSSYVHSIFVYYICHRLLKSHLRRTAELATPEQSHTRRRLAACAVGFLINQNLASRLATFDTLPEGIGEMMDLMQRKMKDEYRVHGPG